MTPDTRTTRGTQGDLGWSRARWRSAAFEVARDAMLILDDAAVCIDANASARRLLDAGAAGLSGRRIDEFADPAVLGARSSRWPVFMADGRDEGECELRRADGARVRVEFALTARIGSNRHLAVLRAGAQAGPVEPLRPSVAEASRLMSDVIRHVNHDLRTPLNGVVGASGLLAETELSQEQREYVELLLASGDALTAVIDDISGFPGADDGSPATEAETSGSSARENLNPAALGRLVLVVEDDHSSRLVAVRLMQARGLEVDAVASGRDALAALESSSYDAIFMNCEMPDLDGYATTREIRRREGDERHVPIIAMTASTMPGDAERCRAAGMDFYVAKPIKAAGLDYIIARAIGTGEN